MEQASFDFGKDFLPDDLQEDGDDFDEIELLTESEDVLTLTTDWTAFTVVHSIKKGVIDLNPRFQRRQAWNLNKRNSLIYSLIESIPVPQIVLAENPNEKDKYIVIDGKQRLLSLIAFIGENKGFEKDKLIYGTSETKGYYYEQLPQYYQNKIDNAVIRTVILKNASTNFLRNAFLKLNIGSLPLSPQELRQALAPGGFTDFVDDFAITSPAVKRLLNLEHPDPRMRDTEIAIRYFSYINNINNYNGDLKKFLDEFCRTMNFEWQEQEEKIKEQANNFENILSSCEEIFGIGNVAKKWNGKEFENQINRAVFDVMFYFFQSKEIRQLSIARKESVLTAFKELCTSNQKFKSAIEYTTKSVERTNDRINIWGNKLSEILEIKIETPNLTVKSGQSYGLPF